MSKLFTIKKHPFLHLGLILLFYSFSHLYAQTVHYTSFEDAPVGEPYTRTSWQSEGFSVPWVNGFNDNRAYIDDTHAQSGNKSLRILFPAAGVGPSESGAQAPLVVPAADQYYISYWMRFSENFSWGTTSEGGKLPGLAGGNRCSGCSVCNGTNGFSARLMWRPQGRAVLYLYHMDKANNCGDDLNLLDANDQPIYFQRGEWYQITQRVKINTGSNNDGEVELWVNGQHALLVENLKFVTNGDKVDNLYFSTFHGGSGAGWAPGVDCHMWFDDVIISTNPNDVFAPLCASPDLGADKTLCGSGGSITLNASLPTQNRNFAWTKDGQAIGGNTATLTITEPGEYKIVADSAGCISSDEVTISNVLLPDLGESKTLCQYPYEELNAGISGAGISYAWKKDGIVLQGETQQTLGIYSGGEYTVLVSTDECETATSSLTVVSQLLSVAGDTICEPGEVVLRVLEEGGSYQWSTTSVTQDVLNSGNEYRVQIAQSTSFFVRDVSGVSALVGRFAPDFTNNRTWGDDRHDRKIRFETFRSLTIDSISVYPEDEMDVTIRILAADNSTIVFQKVFPNLGTGEQRIPIDCSLTEGVYFMDGLGTTGRLRYSNENDPNIQFPYTLENVISLTSFPQWVQDFPRYMYFYKWRVSSGNACEGTYVHAVLNPELCDCNGDKHGTAIVDSCMNCAGGNTGRSPILDPDACVTAIEEQTNKEINIYPNPLHDQMYIVASGVHKIEILDLEGRNMFEQTLSNTNLIDLSGLARGMYLVKMYKDDTLVTERIVKQ